MNTNLRQMIIQVMESARVEQVTQLFGSGSGKRVGTCHRTFTPALVRGLLTALRLCQATCFACRRNGGKLAPSRRPRDGRRHTGMLEVRTGTGSMNPAAVRGASRVDRFVCGRLQGGLRTRRMGTPVGIQHDGVGRSPSWDPDALLCPSATKCPNVCARASCAVQYTLPDPSARRRVTLFRADEQPGHFFHRCYSPRRLDNAKGLTAGDQWSRIDIERPPAR